MLSLPPEQYYAPVEGFSHAAVRLDVTHRFALAAGAKPDESPMQMLGRWLPFGMLRAVTVRIPAGAPPPAAPLQYRFTVQLVQGHRSAPWAPLGAEVPCTSLPLLEEADAFHPDVGRMQRRTGQCFRYRLLPAAAVVGVQLSLRYAAGDGGAAPPLPPELCITYHTVNAVPAAVAATAEWAASPGSHVPELLLGPIKPAGRRASALLAAQEAFSASKPPG